MDKTPLLLFEEWLIETNYKTPFEINTILERKDGTLWKVINFHTSGYHKLNYFMRRCDSRGNTNPWFSIEVINGNRVAKSNNPFTIVVNLEEANEYNLYVEKHEKSEWQLIKEYEEYERDRLENLLRY